MAFQGKQRILFNILQVAGVLTLMELIDQVNRFTHQGQLLVSNGKSDDEIIVTR